MLASQIPAKFPVVFGASASGANIRTVPTTSADPNAASLTLGFPSNTFVPVTSGGSPPDGRDVNGILNALCAWAQWLSMGGIPKWDSAQSAAVGGYFQGAIVASNVTVGYFFFSLVDGNTTDPDSALSAGWQPFSLQTPASTGDVKMTFKTTADPGWVIMNDGSIGNASSNATTRANADTVALFTLLYNNIVDAWAPIQTSAGSATTRAAQGTAAAAYAANCRLVLPKVLGRAIASAGAGAGLTSRALGSTTGEETHILTIPEIPSHLHNFTFNTVGLNVPGGATVVVSSINGGGTTTGTQSTGDDDPHNNMQPSVFLSVMVKL